MNGLLTDLYELTMAAGYLEAGKPTHRATFELSIRRLPRNRTYVAVRRAAAGARVSSESEFHRGRNRLPSRSAAIRQVSAGFFDYLREFRFTRRRLRRARRARRCSPASPS